MSDLVGNPKDRFSRVAAQLVLYIFFSAFIQMLEQPLSASHWLSDAETGPVLVQVSRIYHAEKNSEQQQNYEAEQLVKSNGQNEKCKKSSSS